LLRLKSLESFFAVNLRHIFFLFFLSKEDPDKASRLVTVVKVRVLYLLIPKSQRAGCPLCLRSEHAYNIVVQLREINSSYVAAKILGVMDGENSL